MASALAVFLFAAFFLLGALTMAAFVRARLPELGRLAARRAALGLRRRGYLMRAALVEGAADEFVAALREPHPAQAVRYVNQMRARRGLAPVAALLLGAVSLPGCSGGDVVVSAFGVVALAVALLLGRDAARAAWFGVRSVLRYLPQDVGFAWVYLTRRGCPCGCNVMRNSQRGSVLFALRIVAVAVRARWRFGVVDAQQVATLRRERAAGVLQ